jgi:hypothetical protein
MRHVEEPVHIPVHGVPPLLRRELADVRLVDLCAGRVRDGVCYRLQIDLDRELEDILQSDRAVDVNTSDPEARRDALERAVRRIWGSAQ